MSQDPAAPSGLSLALYDWPAVEVILRDWTPGRLREELWAGRLGARLEPEETLELEEHLTVWVQRALGQMSLRDAMLVDARRGRRVFVLLCADLTLDRAPVPAGLEAHLPPAPARIEALPGPLAAVPALASLGRRAAAEGLALVAQACADEYPFPDGLMALTPPRPRAYRAPAPLFEQPIGWRRRIAILLAAAGVALLVLPMLIGHIPDHPAGLPLAMITLALLVGIQAGWAGFAGGLCIWLVANLPGFRHGSSLVATLWPALPLMAVGLALLSLDRRVRGLWRWLRGRARP